MKIVITGAGGSLGRAFCEYLSHKGLEIVGIDNSEWAIAEMKDSLPYIDRRLMDFADYEFTNEDFLIHCAAYKHVNLGEQNISSFIENNITKTNELFRKAKRTNIGILFISTDKAVEPISVYGMTKSLGEALARSYGGSVARLGNVLSSSGSVIPSWEQSIKNQEPIKITDMRMKRYVIDANKAVEEIWAGFTLGYKLIIPDMGEPVEIQGLLREVLIRHGYKKMKSYPGGVKIIGIRQGERLEEKLRWDNEEENICVV